LTGARAYRAIRLIRTVYRSEKRPIEIARVLHGARDVQSVLSDGITYVIEGGLTTPSGRMPRVRAIWLVETGRLAPRFITAYPLQA
jgi:hypothetical protein